MKKTLLLLIMLGAISGSIFSMEEYIPYRTSIVEGSRFMRSLMNQLPENLVAKLQRQPDDNRRNPNRFNGIDLFIDLITSPRLALQLYYIDKLQPGTILVGLLASSYRESALEDITRRIEEKGAIPIFFNFRGRNHFDIDTEQGKSNFGQLDKLIQALTDKGF